MGKSKLRSLFHCFTGKSSPDASPVLSPSAQVQPEAEQSQSALPLHPSSPAASDREPAPCLSQQERIWRKAYDAAKEEEPDLVRVFENIVLAQLRDNDKSTRPAGLAGTNEETSQTVTPFEMQQFVQEGIARMAKETSVKQEINDGLQPILTIRGIIDGALRAAPEAATVWAIVSLGIEVLSNPITESLENHAGIQYVLCQMKWYWNLTDLLLDENKCDTTTAAMQDELEKDMVHLFQKLLVYQMRSIRRYHRSRAAVVARDMIRIDDWTGQLEDIKEAEGIVQHHMDQYNTQESKMRLQGLKETADGLQQSLRNIDKEIGQQAKRHEDENNKQCLSDLHITDPCTDKKNIEEKKGGLLKDSYKWILEHADFQQFLNEVQSGMLWIRGDPGKGKTMLLCGIINELELLFPAAPISYFFCQATGGSRANTATSVLRGLIYRLARLNPQLTKHVREKYDYKKDFLDTESAWHDLCEILTNMLNDPSVGTTILILDALDECTEDLQRLLDFITKPSPAKWIVSSRNWPDIETELSSGDQGFTIHLELNRDSVSKAVESYINFKVQKLAEHKRYDQAMKDAVLKHLTTHADGTFLWVALVCQELSDMRTRKRHTPRTLKEFPPGLSPLYGRMLEHISRTSDGPIYKRVLATVLTVYRPLTLQQLQALVGELENYDEEDVEEIIASCGSFLTIHSSFVLFVHQSAKDYLLGEASAEILPSGIVDQHQTIFAQSLDLLCRTLKRDIYHLQAPGCLIDEVSVPDPDPLAPVQYSCLFWVDHFEDSAGCELNSGEDKMLSFFKKDYLHWLEALSLMKNISAAARAVGKLQAYLQSKASKDLRDIIQDARLFLLSHAAIIETAPLQIYISALIFSPTNSLTRRNFSHEQPGWIDLSPRVGEGWNACQQILKGHGRSVQSVVFSNDGQRLASRSFDDTVKIWNATSGVCLHTFESHCDLLGLVSIMFSNDGQRLALGCKDHTAKIWDVTSGACLHTLEGHDDTVTSVVFSPDGHRLASGSWDKTVKIWDATSGACLHTLEGHRDWVKPVVFSNDGQRLATASNDRTVKIWDATSGTCLHTLQGHDGWITSVAFTNNGHRLASGSMGKALRMCMNSASDAVKSKVNLANMQMRASGLHSNTVKIWDATSGVCLHTLKGHHSDVKLVVFSNSGQRLASVSFDGTVKIWDATSGACLHTLKDYKDVITSVVFSPDGHRLASGSWDKTVKIWDATFGSCLHTLKGHHSDVKLVVFSNSGQRLASGSDDETVKIWDATSGTCLQTLEGHDDLVTSVVFSNDGQRLASGSDDETVKIWDATSGTCLQTLEGHDYTVTSVVFSPDGDRLASASQDKTVKIWDATFGSCLQTLEGHHDEVTSVVFSNDGQRLASASSDKTVRIWDATLGTSLQTPDGHDETVTSVVFSNDGQRLASLCDHETVKIWDVTSGAHLHTLEGHYGEVNSAAFSNDGQRLASGSWDNTVKIWDVTSGTCLHTFKVCDGVITSVVFSHDGQRLASWSAGRQDKTTLMYSGAPVYTVEGHDKTFKFGEFSEDINPLPSKYDGKAVKVWDVTSGECLNTLEGRDEMVMSAVFSNDGQRLVSGSREKTVNIWDVTSGTCLHTLKGHRKAVTSVMFSNDGQQLASGSWDKTVKIWDATSGECLHTLQGHNQAIASVVFSSDGRRLASRCRDKAIKIWDVTSGKCLHTSPVVNTFHCPSTDVGFLDIQPQTAPTPPSIHEPSLVTSSFCSYSVCADGTWVMKDGQRVLCLPPSHRPNMAAVFEGKRLVLAPPSGSVIIIGFR
ncbi:putative WD repeat-containing protein alr3466 [Ceratocystis fimbriata CBS 114723]|uniref:Mitochondrial division protein 1 n=1 Tax=Ceratocystis fimbriata CBS 114723 TaxID=1035309 RepID=A0A2C5XJS5_9PEZI|nr:putative WD repeat-containing protein alr3466 [Ceratocystis fimbriata CBS 114723]